MRRYLLALIVAIPAAIVALLWTSPPVTAQPVPPPGLRVCTTDSTLTGNCTVASPLGVDIPGTGSPCVAGTAVDNITSDGTASCGATVGTGDIEGVTTSGILTGGCTSGTCSLDTSITG
ncbi:MAG TPA: hypothetical protein VM764_04310, partial [Gemmatimonadaceae bacterium]|nr:hypothetical protein [Gemmatimonadaceae bacterium]